MIFIAFLRGINVSGQKRILMTDLKELFESLGFTNIQTYIQSGNVLFDSSSPDDLSLKIEKALRDHYSCEIPVFCYSPDDLNYYMESFPFGSDHPDIQGNKTYLTLFNTEPENRDMVNKFVHPSEKLVYSKSAVWIYCPEGYGKSKLTNSFLEKKLRVIATTRNLKTLLKMLQMVQEFKKNG